jgi:hypothetical protein
LTKTKGISVIGKILLVLCIHISSLGLFPASAGPSSAAAPSSPHSEDYQGDHFFFTRHGQGSLLYTNTQGIRCSYEGEFVFGKKKGWGKLTNEEGTYVGKFSWDVKSGLGYHEDSERYIDAVGLWKNDLHISGFQLRGTSETGREICEFKNGRCLGPWYLLDSFPKFEEFQKLLHGVGHESFEYKEF